MNETTMTVAYHYGGQMFAGDETDYAPGWYLYTDDGATLVDVLEPGTDNPLEVQP